MFRAKAKKKVPRARKTTIPNKARPYKAPPKGQFAPSRARPAALKGQSGPDLLDLLCLHFKDQGYKAKTTPGGNGLTFLKIDITGKMPYVGVVGLGGAPAVVEFFYLDRMVSYRKPWPYGVLRDGKDAIDIPLGAPEDPHLIRRMEGTIEAYIAGAAQLGQWVKASLK